MRRLSFDDQSGVVPLARDFTRQALYAWGWLPAASADRRAAAEDVLLVVSELVTNACLHAEGPDQLRITCDNKVIRVEVADRGTGQPAPAPRTARGARAVMACSSSSACAWTGASSVRRGSPARRSGRSWAPPPDRGECVFLIAGSARSAPACCRPASGPCLSDRGHSCPISGVRADFGPRWVP